MAPGAVGAAVGPWARTSSESDRTPGPDVIGGNGFDLVLIFASAGALAAIPRVLDTLPPDFPVPIVVVQHRDPVTEA